DSDAARGQRHEVAFLAGGGVEKAQCHGCKATGDARRGPYRSDAASPRGERTTDRVRAVIVAGRPLSHPRLVTSHLRRRQHRPWLRPQPRSATSAVAIAATPSPRPVSPRPSVVVPETLTGAPSAADSAAC